MAPSPNRNMQQRDMRPTAPINSYRKPNQPGPGVNQNGQVSPTPKLAVMGSPAMGMTPPMSSVPTSSPSTAMPMSNAPSQEMPQNRYQPAIEPMPSGPMQDAPSPANYAAPTQGAMSAPGMPQAARQNTSAPQPPGQPYARQNMPQQQATNRRMSPQMS